MAKTLFHKPRCSICPYYGVHNESVPKKVEGAFLRVGCRYCSYSMRRSCSPLTWLSLLQISVYICADFILISVDICGILLAYWRRYRHSGRLPGKEINTMAVSKAQQRAVTKYDAKTYDKTLLRLPKGRLDIVRTHATAHGESVNGFIGRAISEAMERDGGGTASETAGKPAGAAQGVGVALHSKTLKAAQRAAEAAGEALPDFMARAIATQAKRDALSRRMEGAAE